MIIDCTADLHGYYPKMEGGDLLIVGGDLTAKDDLNSWNEFYNWLHIQQEIYEKIIIVAGNHDKNINEQFLFLELKTSYLRDSGTEFEGLKIWGSPWTKTFPGMNPKCKAFTCDREEELEEKWALIPDDINILVTHCPPCPAYGIYAKTNTDELFGSTSLLIRVATIKPLIHVFGHIHEKGSKKMFVPWKGGTHFINCSHVNEHYQPINKPIRVIL